MKLIMKNKLHDFSRNEDMSIAIKKVTALADGTLRGVYTISINEKKIASGFISNIWGGRTEIECLYNAHIRNHGVVRLVVKADDYGTPCDPLVYGILKRVAQEAKAEFPTDKSIIRAIRVGDSF